MGIPMGSAPTVPGRPRALGDIAHDFRSGLSATQAYLDLARERLTGGEAVADEDLARLERGIHRLAATLADLEAVAKAKPQPKEGSR